MSKPRSNLYDYDKKEPREVRGFTTAVHYGKQIKHMPGKKGYDPSKSPVTLDIVEIQRLIDRKAGTGKWCKPNKEVIDFRQIIGIFKDDSGIFALPTTRATIHYSKTGCHLVPAAPKE